MTSKVQPAAGYLTFEPLTEKTWCYFWWAEKQRTAAKETIKNGDIIWMASVDDNLLDL